MRNVLAKSGVSFTNLTPNGWQAVERARLEWRRADGGDPAAAVQRFLAGHGLPVADLARPPGPDPLPAHPAGHAGCGLGTEQPSQWAVLLVGADAGAVMAGLPVGAATPSPAVPDLVAVVYQRGSRTSGPSADTTDGEPARVSTQGRGSDGFTAALRWAVGEWRSSWSDRAHADAVRAVREAIADGAVYQVNVVGHRSARYRGDPAVALRAVSTLPGATHGGLFGGQCWAVACASPECLVSVRDGVARTRPVKGTRPATPGGRRALLASAKERAEHVMIVDLERNDLGRLAQPGSVHVESLFELREWCGLWQAESTVAARLRPGVGLADLLRALLPGGSVTGAPKVSAVGLAASLEPVGRGPAMGALGVVTADRVDLGLTIRTVAVDGERVHLWAGGGVTWGSDPSDEVAEAHAKAAPLVRALGSG